MASPARSPVGCRKNMVEQKHTSVLVSNAFVGTIIRIGKQGMPTLWKRGVVHSEAMVLRCNVAAASAQVDTRLVP